MLSIGIDLGTYNSAAAYIDINGKTVLLRAYHGPTYQGVVIPSFVKFRADGEFDKYGEQAREDWEIAPEQVVWGVKRILGVPYQMAKEIGELERFQYPVQETADGAIQIPITPEKIYTPADITRLLLEKIKMDCEAPFNPVKSRITRAIITHPAYFDGIRIKAIEDAALNAGFEQIEMLSEPEAASRSYRDIIDFRDNQYVLVIDWGAGTLDMVIARFHIDHEGNARISSTSPPYGDNHLGGIDMDDSLMKEIINRFDMHSMDASEMGKLRSQVERGKIELSSKPWTVRYTIFKGQNITLKLARSTQNVPDSEDIKEWIILDKALKDILEKFRQRLKFVLREVDAEEIDQLLLVGGPMFMPCVRQVIREVFEDNDRVVEQLNKIETEGFSVSPLEAVVRGAASFAEQNHGGIPPNEQEDPYGWGYLLNGIVGEVLIEPKSRKGDSRKREQPLTSQTPPGVSIPLSLLKMVVTFNEDNYEKVVKQYYRRGDYKFVLVHGPDGTSFTPEITLGENRVPILSIIDHNSSNPPLTLQIAQHADYPTPEPKKPKIVEIKKISKKGTYREKLISEEEVIELRKNCEAAILFVKNKIASGVSISSSSRNICDMIEKAIKELPEGPANQQRYQIIHNLHQELRSSLIANDHISENELR